MRCLLLCFSVVAVLSVATCAPQRERGEDFARSPLGSLLGQIHDLRSQIRDNHAQVIRAQAGLIPLGLLGRPPKDKRRPSPSRNQPEESDDLTDSNEAEDKPEIQNKRKPVARRPLTPNKNNESPDQSEENEDLTDLNKAEDKPEIQNKRKPAPRRPLRPNKNSESPRDEDNVQEPVEKKRKPSKPVKELGQEADTSLDLREADEENLPERPQKTTNRKKSSSSRRTTPMTPTDEDLPEEKLDEEKPVRRTQSKKTSTSAPEPTGKGSKTPKPLGVLQKQGLAPPAGIHPPPAHGTTEDWSDVSHAADEGEDEFHVTRKIIGAPCLGGIARDGSCRESFE